MFDDNDFPSKTFCALPWVHLSTRTDGRIRVCCTATASSVSAANKGNTTGIIVTDKQHHANFANMGIDEAWNSDYMKSIRLKMLNGEMPESCVKCFREEEAGVRSKRLWETRKWIRELGIDEIIGTTEPDGTVENKIRYIDLRLGSKCQLACAMCSPNDSSGWIPEYKKIFSELSPELQQSSIEWKRGPNNQYNWHKKNPIFWMDMYEQIPNLKQLYFAGGEPLIIKDHYELLEECIRQGHAKDIELRYNSNSMEWRDDLFELWKEFKHVIFHISIDDIEDRLEYIRYPASWEVLKENMFKFDNYPYDNLELTTACTINALNIYHIPEFVKWKMTQGFKKLNSWPHGCGTISMHLGYHPPHLNVKVLPKEFKTEIEKRYEEFYVWLEDNWELALGAPSQKEFVEAESSIYRFKSLISFMNSEDWSEKLPITKEWCDKLSEHRNLDFYSIFPEWEWLRDV